MKSIIRSKTFWFNVAVIIVSLAGAFGIEADQQMAGVFVGVIGIVLRTFTTTAVHLK